MRRALRVSLSIVAPAAIGVSAKLIDGRSLGHAFWLGMAAYMSGQVVGWAYAEQPAPEKGEGHHDTCALNHGGSRCDQWPKCRPESEKKP